MANKYLCEMCVASTQGIEVARDLGADRIELCSALSEGGLTPSLGLLSYAVRNSGATKVNVLIRPRAGDFVYSDAELEVMRDDIIMAREAGANAVVIGVLNPDGSLNYEAMKYLLEAAWGPCKTCCDRSEPLKVTCHRAFDVCCDYRKTLEQLIELGVDHVLTSGGESNALRGAQLLRELNEAYGDKISLIAGAGVNEGNVAAIARVSSVKEFHFSAKGMAPSQMVYRNPKVYMGMPGSDDYDIPVTSKHTAQAIIAALKAL